MPGVIRVEPAPRGVWQGVRVAYRLRCELPCLRPALLFNVELVLSHEPPYSFRQVATAVTVDPVAEPVVEDVIECRVHLVRGLATRPMQRLAGVMLVVAETRNADDFEPGVGEVAEHEREQLELLTLLGISG